MPDCFTGNLRLISIVEYLGLRAVFSVADPKYPCVCLGTMLKILCSKEEFINLILQKDLVNVSILDVTRYFWNDERRRSFCSFKVHYVDMNRNFKLLLLSCASLIGSHTARELADIFVKIGQIFVGIMNMNLFIYVDEAANSKELVNMTSKEHTVIYHIDEDVSGPAEDTGTGPPTVSIDAEDEIPTTSAKVSENVELNGLKFYYVDALLSDSELPLTALSEDMSGLIPPNQTFTSFMSGVDGNNSQAVDAQAHIICPTQLSLHLLPCTAHTI